MSGYQITTGGHLGDAILLQLIDQEPVASAEARAHLGSCESCTARFDRMRRAGELLRGALPDIAMPQDLIREGARRHAWVLPIPMAAAAALVVLATAAAATPPVREWIMRHLAPEPAARPAATPPASAPAGVTTNAGTIASFAPTDTALVIRFDRRQSHGALEIRVTGSDRVSAQAIGGTAAEEMVVLPGELRVLNGATSLADYRVTVPVSVRIVQVLIGDAEVLVFRTTSGLERRIHLR